MLFHLTCTWTLYSQQQHASGDWGTHLMQASLSFLGWGRKPEGVPQWAGERVREWEGNDKDRERNGAAKTNSSLSKETITVQLQSAAGWWAHIINNLYKLLGPGGAIQLLTIPQLWQILIVSTLHTLWRWIIKTWLLLFDIRSNLSGCVCLMQKKFFFSSHLLCEGFSFYFFSPDSSYWLPCFDLSSRQKNRLDPSSWWQEQSLWSPRWRQGNRCSHILDIYWV